MKQKALDEFVKGEPLSQKDIDKALEQMRKDNPNMSNAAIEEIKKKLAAQGR